MSRPLKAVKTKRLRLLEIMEIVVSHIELNKEPLKRYGNHFAKSGSTDQQLGNNFQKMESLETTVSD